LDGEDVHGQQSPLVSHHYFSLLGPEFSRTNVGPQEREVTRLMSAGGGYLEVPWARVPTLGCPRGEFLSWRVVHQISFEEISKGAPLTA